MFKLLNNILRKTPTYCFLKSLRKTLDEALVQEELIGVKMETAQTLLESIKKAVSSNWTSLISEDELLTKIERLESQLGQKFGEKEIEEIEKG
jgi:predicted  nucleic acid-binding Zn-ribbon protein